MIQNGIRALLEKHPVIPVVTFHKEEEIEPLIEKLLEQNIRCIEITLRTDYALEAIKYTKERFSEQISVGVGTVVTIEQIHAVKALNVNFIVSPALHENLIVELNKTNIPYIPAAVTPSEFLAGMQLGCDTFKFFPASLFGGLDALKTYGSVFHQLKFCPTGGIKADTYTDYLKLDNVISVGGSWMVS